MIKLQIHNDGKEKYQSFEARLNDFDSIVHLEGYGQDKEEAIKELKEKVEQKIKEYQEIDWDNFDWIDWKGDKIWIILKKKTT